MTVHEKIANTATTEPEPRSLMKIRRHGSGKRKQMLLEFLKWFFLCYGVIGILGVWVAYDRFLTWIETLNPLALKNIAEIFSYEIAGTLPFATVIFTGALILACVIAALQKKTEVVSRIYAGEAARTLSEISTNLEDTQKVFNDFYSVKASLSELSLDLNEAKNRLLKESDKNQQTTVRLKEARNTISRLRRKVRELTGEQNKLKERLKLFQQEFNLLEINGIGPKTLEKLRNVGIYKTSDLLRVAPEDLADETGISPKLIIRWLEDASKLSRSHPTV